MKKHNHRWLKDGKDKDGNTVNFCSTCQCKRITNHVGKFKFYQYVRSGIIFGEERPDCIDWDEENNKTID